MSDNQTLLTQDRIVIKQNSKQQYLLYIDGIKIGSLVWVNDVWGTDLNNSILLADDHNDIADILNHLNTNNSSGTI